MDKPSPVREEFITDLESYIKNFNSIEDLYEYECTLFNLLDRVKEELKSVFCI